MKNAIKTFIRKYIDAVMFDTKVERLAEEGIWHHVFRESFRSGGWKNEVGISMGRWAGGASFFYVLHRILEDIRPTKIVELGLGEGEWWAFAYLALFCYTFGFRAQSEAVSATQENVKFQDTTEPPQIGWHFHDG